jgi:hypothetical protein
MNKILTISLLCVYSIYNFELNDNILGFLGLVKDPV